MTTYEQVEEIVLEILEKDILVRPRATFSLDDHLTYDLHIDTDDLSFILIPVLEERVGVRAPAHEWSKCGTGREAAALMFKYVKTARRESP